MKTIIHTKHAPEPIGPYSQAVLVDNTLYTSGQIAMDPTSNGLVMATIEAETQQVMENLRAVLAAANMNFNNVVKSSIYISDMQNFTAINKVYAGYFSQQYAPARETVEVSNLPKFVNVEISMIAVK